MSQHHTIAISFLVRRTRANGNGDIPIYIRILINSKPTEIAIKQYVKPDLWSLRKGRVKGNSEYARTINKAAGQQ